MALQLLRQVERLGNDGLGLLERAELFFLLGRVVLLELREPLPVMFGFCCEQEVVFDVGGIVGLDQS